MRRHYGCKLLVCCFLVSNLKVKHFHLFSVIFLKLSCTFPRNINPLGSVISFKYRYILQVFENYYKYWIQGTTKNLKLKLKSLKNFLFSSKTF